MRSINPATGETVWEGEESDEKAVDKAVKKGKETSKEWAAAAPEERISILHRFKELLEERKEPLAFTVSQEMGKPLWEAAGEVEAAIGKVDLSIQAHRERCPTREMALGKMMVSTRHKPIGLLAVFGPFNFPVHLPGGHIVPALLAGNSVIFKPSEQTPHTGEALFAIWREAQLPEGVLQLVQGGKECGAALANHPGIDGLLFTGSWKTGSLLHKAFAAHPEKILALEMGGNAPLVVWDAGDLNAALYLVLQSAFITSGQRCSCARRLILPKNSFGKEFLNRLAEAAKKLKAAPFTEKPEPFMGPVISEQAAEGLIAAQEGLIEKGAAPLLKMERNGAFLTAGILDASSCREIPDEELFGPLLKVHFAATFEEAVKEANTTAYGLAAAVVTEEPERYRHFFKEVRAGVINWNMPTTGASGAAPFGGVGKSGNHRPSGYYAADYCAYPVASQEKGFLSLPERPAPGVVLDE